MNESAELPASRPVPVRSERFRLAALARDAALRLAGVVGTDIGPGGAVLTVDGAERLEGVLCVASRAGGYDITLRLVCRMVPLAPLGQEVRAAVIRAASRAGVSVDEVNVQIAALDEITAR